MTSIPTVTRTRTGFRADVDTPPTSLSSSSLSSFLDRPDTDADILDEQEQEEIIQSFRVESENMRGMYQ
ncbi:hypothetical protein HK104_006234, partial [Borealophlyctis nickersoniae]